MPEELKNLIRPALSKLHLQKKADMFMAVFLWNTLLGKEILKNSQAVSVKGGVLFVKAKNPVWAFELSKLKRDIIEKINRSLGKKTIKDIRFSAGALHKKKDSLNEGDSLNTDISLLTQNEKEKIKEAVSLIQDPSLQRSCKIFLLNLKALEKSKKSAGWKECKVCSSFIERAGLCPLCQAEENEKKQTNLYRLLWQAPWLSFAGAKNALPVITQNQYLFCKNSLLDILYKEICLAGQEKNEARPPAQGLKNKLLTYALLKTGLPPENLTDQIINTTLDKNLPKKIRKNISFT